MEDFFFLDIKLTLKKKISKPLILQQVCGRTEEQEFLKQPIGDFYGHEDILIDHL